MSALSLPPLLLMAFLLSSPPNACSCVPPEHWTMEQARAEGAVFAEVTPVGERTEPFGLGRDLRIYTARVHRAIGLKPGGMIEIATPADTARCGIVLAPDLPRWLLLREQPEGWSAERCWQLPLEDVAPEEWDRLAPR